MHVLRGRPSTPAANQRIIDEMIRRAAEGGEESVRVWRPRRHVAFGPRDTNDPAYPEARRIAESRGFVPVERSVGGRAVAHTGATLAFARCHAVDAPRRDLRTRYRVASRDVRAALETIGVDATTGEPDDSFCPGTHSLQADGKIVGIAQRVRRGAALVSGVIVVADREAMAEVLEPVYEVLGVPFDPSTVGSIAAAGGPSEPAPVARAIERAFVDDGTRATEWIGDRDRR